MILTVLSQLAAPLWTAIAIAGATIQGAAVRDSWLDYRTLKKLKVNGALILICRMGLRTATTGLVLELLFVGIGGLALVNRSPQTPSLRGVLIAYGIVVAAASTVVVAYANGRDRGKLRTIYSGQRANVKDSA